MYNLPILNTPSNNGFVTTAGIPAFPHVSIGTANQANPSQIHVVTLTEDSNIDWSSPPYAGGLVATSKDGDSLMMFQS